jgi:carotenoid cleavage dioxygenase
MPEITMTVLTEIAHPYLTGNFAPVHSEDEFANLPRTGEWPAELRGTLYRNGPNPQFDPRDSHYHWFAGDGMIHAFAIADGRVDYRNRYVPTPKYRAERAAGRALFGTFGNPVTSDVRTLGKDSGLANTKIVWHGGRLLALEEAHQPFELDPLTLEGRGYRDYAGAARRFTAHPKIDPETGELVFFGYSAGKGFFNKGMVYGVADRNGVVTRLDRFRAPYPSMVHDFFVTRNYVLFPILPLVGSLARAMTGRQPFAWEPERGAHIAVMRRDAGSDTIRWFRTDPCYVFHPMNMWEEGERIVVDVMEYPRAPLFPDANGDGARPVTARLRRWTFDLAGATDDIRREDVDDASGEFPRFDERRAGLPYRHGYFVADSSGASAPKFDSIAHIDHGRGVKTVYTFANGDVPSEPVFVPRNADAAEGDGFLLAVVYRGAEDRSDLVLFDAGHVAGGPIATARLPRRVPFGFHGNWRGAD